MKLSVTVLTDTHHLFIVRPVQQIKIFSHNLFLLRSFLQLRNKSNNSNPTLQVGQCLCQCHNRYHIPIFSKCGNHSLPSIALIWWSWQILFQYLIVNLTKDLWHDKIYICANELTSLITQHFLYVIVCMNNLSQTNFTTINHNYCSFCIVCVFVWVVVNFWGLFQVL